MVSSNPQSTLVLEEFRKFILFFYFILPSEKLILGNNIEPESVSNTTNLFKKYPVCQDNYFG